MSRELQGRPLAPSMFLGVHQLADVKGEADAVSRMVYEKKPRRPAIAALALAVFGLAAAAGGAPTEKIKPSYVPTNGFVPDKQTAETIAMAVLIPIYGKEQIEDERPFTVELHGDAWKVFGHLSDRWTEGGVAEAWIDKRTGQILRVVHGK